ncbi:DUF3592 domain-containing protein [Streptomyces goshikiensis]|uniref:DUF3592 domain-containing protein n=1 Tax=Streptomyces goshikiensis TaxID=1942 RepID=UPI0037F4D5DE
MSVPHALWLFALLFTPAGAVIGIVAGRQALQARRLLRCGSVAQGYGHAAGAGPDRSRLGQQQHDQNYGTTVCCPVVAWTTAGGRAMESRARIAWPAGRVRPIGPRVEIRHDPADPAQWTLPIGGIVFWWLFAGMGVVFSMVGLGFLLGALPACA